MEGEIKMWVINIQHWLDETKTAAAVPQLRDLGDVYSIITLSLLIDLQDADEILTFENFDPYFIENVRWVRSCYLLLQAPCNAADSVKTASRQRFKL